ncbi:MAG: nucleotidyltransferase family protein [Jejuia sp.]
MSSTSNIAIAILAAGASSRMGSPKQVLKWGNTSLLEHAITNSKKSNAKEVIVVLGANNDTISSQITTDDVSVVINKEWEKGLGRSIASAVLYVLDSNKVEGLLIVLADQPFVTSTYLNEMILTFNLNTGKIIATAYDSDRFGVPALFDKSYFEELSRLVGDEGAKAILKKYNHQVVVLSPDFQNWDIDTKEDYKRLKK